MTRFLLFITAAAAVALAQSGPPPEEETIKLAGRFGRIEYRDYGDLFPDGALRVRGQERYGGSPGRRTHR